MTVDLPPKADPIQSDELTLDGFFGSTPGTVSIGDTPVVVHSWSTKQVVVGLPSANGPGYDGDVMVKVNDVESNVVPLTSWRPKFTYVHNLLGKSSYPNETMTVVFDAALRADLHFSRPQPGKPPVPPSDVFFVASRDSKATYKAEGTDVAPGPLTCTTTGGGDLPYGLTGVSPGYSMTGHLQHPSANVGSKVAIVAAAPSVFTTACTSPGGNYTLNPSLLLDTATCPVPPDGVPFNLSSGFTLLGDTRTTTSDPEVSASLKWSSVDAQSPPDMSKGEDSKH
jgi:hypothetical protein